MASIKDSSFAGTMFIQDKSLKPCIKTEINILRLSEEN